MQQANPEANCPALISSAHKISAKLIAPVRERECFDMFCFISESFLLFPSRHYRTETYRVWVCHFDRNLQRKRINARKNHLNGRDRLALDIQTLFTSGMRMHPWFLSVRKKKNINISSPTSLIPLWESFALPYLRFESLLRIERYVRAGIHEERKVQRDDTQHTHNSPGFSFFVFLPSPFCPSTDTSSNSWRMSKSLHSITIIQLTIPKKKNSVY